MDTEAQKTSTIMEIPQGDRYYFHSSPRTASTVLLRVLNLPEQPNLNYAPQDGYFFISHFMKQRKLGVQGKHVNTWTEDERSQVKQALRENFEKFSRFLEETDGKGQKCFIKEHCDFMFDPSAFANFLSPDSEDISGGREEMPVLPRTGETRTWSPENHTLFPDEFLRTWKPTILIRHPALVFPSQFRAFSDIERLVGDNNSWETTMTFNWARSLYSLYHDVIFNDRTHDTGNMWPIVLEAERVLCNPVLIRKYCNLVGLDEEKLRFSWNEAAEGDDLVRNPVASRMSDTLNASTGLIKGKLTTEIDIDVEAGKWREEFGEVVGGKIEKWVRGAMPDYEFLKARSLRE